MELFVNKVLYDDEFYSYETVGLFVKFKHKNCFGTKVYKDLLLCEVDTEKFLKNNNIDVKQYLINLFILEQEQKRQRKINVKKLNKEIKNASKRNK